jgi:hypothetical protein
LLTIILELYTLPRCGVWNPCNAPVTFHPHTRLNYIILFAQNLKMVDILPPCLLDLPTEILLLILSFISQDFGHSPASLLPLSLCNWTLRNLALPLIYKSIHIQPRFEGLGVNLDKRTNLLHQCLLSNPVLRQYVKRVKLTFLERERPSISSVLISASWMQVVQIATWLPNARNLEVCRLTVNAKTYTLALRLFFQCVDNMPFLESVAFYGIWLQDVCLFLQSLQCLSRLSELSLSADHLSADNPDKGIFSLPVKYGSNVLKKLVITGQLPAIYYDRTFPWCRKLQVLDLGHLVHPAATAPWSIESLLLKYIDTEVLQELTFSPGPYIDGYPTTELHQLKLNELISLRKLTISNWLPNEQDSAEDLYSAFLSGAILEIIWIYNEIYVLNRTGKLLGNGAMEPLLTIKDALDISIKSRCSLSKFSLDIIYSTKQANGEPRSFVQGMSATKCILFEIEKMLIDEGITAKCVGDITLPQFS